MILPLYVQRRQILATWQMAGHRNKHAPPSTLSLAKIFPPLVLYPLKALIRDFFLRFPSFCRKPGSDAPKF